jgi:hypothetical protein
MLRPREYKNRPDAFMYDALKIEMHERGEEMCWSVLNHHETAVKGCNKSGKTFQAAAIGHWWLMTEADSVLVTTAPSEDAVVNLFWRDFKAIHDNCIQRGKPLYENPISQAKIDIGPKWYGLGLTARAGNEGHFQGFHSRRVLYVIDEGSAVDKIFFDARHRFAQGTDDRFLMLCNPFALNESYRCFSRAGMNRITISAFDLPNVNGRGKPIPGLLDLATVDKWRDDWGEDSMFWKTRVLAEFWDEGSDGLIPLSWYEAAVARRKQMLATNHTGKKTFSVDVAEAGESETIILRKEGLIVHDAESFGIPDTTQIAHHVEPLYSVGYVLGIPDANGVGAGVASTLRNDGFAILAYKGSLATDETDRTGEIKFANTRSAAYWSVREALNPNNPEAIGLPDDDRLREDLVGLRYHQVAGGKIAIEEKAKVVKRLGRSPDRGDALAMLIWGSNRGGSFAQIATIKQEKRGDVLKRPAPRKTRSTLDNVW